MLAFVRQKVIYCALLVGLFLYGQPVLAQLPVRNHNPLAQNTGLPAFYSARLLQGEQRQLSVQTTLSSHFVPELKQEDPLFFDGETYITDFIWQQALGDYQLRVELPWVGYHHGFMDNFIIDWHDTFGLPSADRDKFDNNGLLFRYQQKGANPETIVLNEGTDGFADLRVAVSGQFARASRQQHAWHVQLKLPTGDSDKWLGSGSTDIALFLSGMARSQRWQADWQYGVLFMSEPDDLKDQRQDSAGFGSLALSFWWTPQLRLLAQADGHTALYKDTSQRALDFGLLGTLGAEWQTAKWRFHTALVEDLHVDSAPDVGFQFSVTRLFH